MKLVHVIPAGMSQKLRKLRRMSANEIRVRIGDMLRRRNERRAYAQSPSSCDMPEGFDSAAFIAGAVKLTSGSRDVGLAGSSVTRSHIDAMRTASAHIAESVLSGSSNMLGHSYDLSGAIDWHKDPRSEHRWPREFYADLSLYDLPNSVDVKYVWELGRHQYVVDLARAWFLGREDRHAARSRDVILDWIGHNPLNEGIHWTSGLEVAMRSISWLWTLSMLAEWDGWREGELRRIASSLADHANYLEHHFSFYSSPYNHLVGESTALYLIARTFEQYPDSERWRQKSRAVLLEHAQKQFYEDGFCVEQATGYHYYTLGFLTMAIVAARNSGEALAELEPVVHKAYRAGMAFRRPDGRWPAIGDLDSARSIPVHHEDFWKFDSLNAVAAVLFDDADLKVVESGPGEELFWLLGNEGVEKWESLATQPATTSRIHLPHSGYCIFRDEDVWSLFDAGPIADGLYADNTPSTAHGHNDTLQVLFFADGRSLLTDCGMPFYGGDPEWVSHFRSAGAHNTLEVDGVAFVRQSGRLGWTHEAACPDLSVDLDQWQARGVATWQQGVTIERSVSHESHSRFAVTDRMTSDKPRRVTSYWQLPSDAELIQSDSHRVEIQLGPDHRLTVESHDAEIEVSLCSATEGSAIAWRAPGYGSLENGKRLVVSTRIEGHQLTTTRIRRHQIADGLDGTALSSTLPDAAGL